MEYSTTWQPEQAEAIYTISLATLAFMIYWFVGRSNRLLDYFQRTLGPDRGQARHVLARRLVGALFFGLLPAMLLLATQPYTLADYGLSFRFTAFDLYWTLGLSLVIILLTIYSAKKPVSMAMYPEIRSRQWNTKLLVQSNLSWMLYLLAYEVMFRGLMLFACARVMGVWPAITISTAIYALAHVPKGETEGIGAIPLGILFCLITLESGTVWVAVLVHWVMALTNEWASLKYHPEIGMISTESDGI